MNDLINNINELSPDRRKLLELLLKEQGVDVSQTLILPRSHDRDRFPLSYPQQRLWFLEQLQPGTALYNIPTAVHMAGNLDLPTLQRSVDALVQRHETLRTKFESEAGQPVQIISESIELPIQLIDLNQFANEKQEAEALRLAREDALCPFDLESGPLFRVTLLRLSDNEHIALLTIHHIISDGWSMSVLIAELAKLYEAFLAGKPSPLPELSIQYVDYALWQQRWLNDGLQEEHLAYWQKELDGAESLLALPTDRPRPAVQANRGASYHFELSPALTAAIKDLSRRAGATYFITLLAIFDVLLYRYSGQDDISIGTPVANRSRAEIEGLLGFFVNTLVLRVDLSGAPSFRELLGRVREVTLEAQSHQDLPFEMLVDDLQPARDMSYSPLFQVMFALQNAPSQALHLPDLTLEQIPVHSETSKFDLTLIISEGKTQFQGNLEYDVDLFSETTIIRMVEHFLMLAEGIVADPDRRISAIPLLTEQEAHKTLVEWNQTSTDDIIDTCIHTMVQDQVVMTPDATALIFGDQTLSYQQLNGRANQLAHYLSDMGVGRGTLVGVSMQRSADMIVGLLAILKASAAYVPIDPTYPEDRKKFISEDAQVKFILTHSSLRDDVPDRAAPLIFLDEIWPFALEQPSENPHNDVSASDLAYVLFTSGSTGQPKGVAISHHSAAALAAWARRVYALDELAGMLASTSINFDLSVFELFATLASGGTLILAENALELPDLVAAHRVTLINTVPSAITALLRSGGIPQSVRTINLAGEPLSARLANQLYEIPWIERVYDLYGPTEDTTYSTWTMRQPQGPETIGRPLYNTQIYILDPWLQPVPVGVPGEIYLGGAGLAVGYLNRFGLTAERFIPNPFLSTEGGIDDVQHASLRLYRTGDLARYLTDGNIEFLGRVDHQVKVRGFRIELGEIETALTRHPALREVVVLAHTDATGNKRLVAYVVPRAEVTVNPADLRGYLLETLPEYMVPGVFLTLDALPLTPNGKVNRKALPAPDFNVLQYERDYMAPRTPAEEILVGIWKELLTAERIGVEDNFFELGGHSLLATQVIARIRDAFEIDMPVRSLFEAPTVAGLTAAIEVVRQARSGLEAPPIIPSSREGNLPLSYSQQRLWFIDQLEPGRALYHIPTNLRLIGAINFQAMEQAINEIVRRHMILRTIFPASPEGQPQQIILPEMPMRLEVTDLSHLAVEERMPEVFRLMEEEVRIPFSLATGPLLRLRILRLDSEDHIVMATMHHIISDGWSAGVLVREFGALYAAYCNGDLSPLPELNLQYADFARWQRNWLTDEVLETQLAYWRDNLGHVPDLLTLPTDRPRPPVQTFKGNSAHVAIPATTAQGLGDISRDSGATLFMTLLAGLQVLLHRYAGQDGISVGTPIANRRYSELESLIGFFVNTLVMHSDLSGNPTFRELLGQVRRVALDAYANQDVPFEVVVNELSPERNMSHSPLFQVMFALQTGISTQPIKLPDLTLQALDTTRGVANFDITLEMAQGPDGLHGAIEYNTDLFNEDTILRFLAHFQMLLSAIVADPDQRIDEIPLLTESEQQQVLQEWNASDIPFASDQTFHGLFEQQVLERPQAVATAFLYEGQEDHLSYDQLNRKANKLAHFLRDQGVETGDIVGISVKRSFEMVIGVLGVMKSGAAYLPLDPTYPPSRLQFMIEDSGINVLLTQEDLRIALLDIQEPEDGSQKLDVSSENPEAEPLNRRSIVCLDADWPIIAHQPDTNLSNLVGPDDLAYVIYTSGSTGLPKGAQLHHRGVCSAAAETHRKFGLCEGKRVMQFAPFSFDASTWEMIMAFSNGATLCLTSQDQLRPGPELLKLFRDHRITTMLLAPTLLAALETEPLPDLEVLITGGEYCPGELVRKWAPGRKFFNAYGPTEATICCSMYLCDPVGDYALGPPIGKPNGNFKLYVLDSFMQPVPIGVPGELHIGGTGVGIGYLNRPELTADCFIDNPFADGQLYRTGDLVRYLTDGNIEFLSRMDHQVKIRGHRIELGEIETVLGSHPDLTEHVVMAREDKPGDKRLVAYFVPAAGIALDQSDLREYLDRRLPDYMVPRFFVELSEMPLTSSLKIDRKALPAPEIERQLDTDFVAPRYPNEVILASIMVDLLGLPEVGVHDSFFELGGDSILSIQLVAKARQAGLHIAAKDIFLNPTIARLAQVANEAPAVAAEQGPAIGPLTLTPIQRWFFGLDPVDRHHWNQALMFTVQIPLQHDLLEQTILKLLAHHDALRLRFWEQNDEWRAEFGELPAQAPLFWHDLTNVSDSNLEGHVEDLAQAAQARLNLEAGQLCRFDYFDFGTKRGARLLIVVHHLAIDGVSWRILLEDLQTGYGQFLSGHAAVLPPKTTSLQFWADQLQNYAATDIVRSEADYWMHFEADKFEPLSLDNPNGDNLEGSKTVASAKLSSKETEALLKDVPPVYRTEINDALLTALARAFHETFGAKYLWLSMEGHGREELFEQVDVSRTVGWFTSMYPLCLDVTAARDPGEALVAVKEQIRAMPQNGIGFGLLKYFSDDRTLVDHLCSIPKPEISFNYLGQIDQALSQVSSFTPANESSGHPTSTAAVRPHILDVSAIIAGGRLQISINYSSHLHRADTINALVQAYLAQLQALIEYCRAAEAGSLTPSDVPLANLSQRQLDKALSQLVKHKRK